MKIIVIYNFFQSDDNRKNNLLFFLKHGIANYPNIDCIIVNRNEKFDINISNYSNVKVINFENIGICINGYKFGLNNIELSNYDYFILMNDSMIGPFYKSSATLWYERFIELINDKVQIVGSYQQNGIPQTGFLFFTLKCAHEIQKILNNSQIKTPKDALTMEPKMITIVIDKLKCETDGTLNKGIRWTHSHSIFDVVFEKENRIETNTSIFWSNRKNKDINFITRKQLNDAIKFMETKNDFN